MEQLDIRIEQLGAIILQEALVKTIGATAVEPEVLEDIELAFALSDSYVLEQGENSGKFRRKAISLNHGSSPGFVVSVSLRSDLGGIEEILQVSEDGEPMFSVLAPPAWVRY